MVNYDFESTYYICVKALHIRATKPTRERSDSRMWYTNQDDEATQHTLCSLQTREELQIVHFFFFILLRHKIYASEKRQSQTGEADDRPHAAWILRRCSCVKAKLDSLSLIAPLVPVFLYERVEFFGTTRAVWVCNGFWSLTLLAVYPVENGCEDLKTRNSRQHRTAGIQDGKYCYLPSPIKFIVSHKVGVVSFERIKDESLVCLGDVSVSETALVGQVHLCWHGTGV